MEYPLLPRYLEWENNEKLCDSDKSVYTINGNSAYLNFNVDDEKKCLVLPMCNLKGRIILCKSGESEEKIIRHYCNTFVTL